MQWHYGYDARGNLVRYYCSENGRLDSYDIKTLEIEYFDAEETLEFGFQVQHPGISGWNRFKNKTLGVS